MNGYAADTRATHAGKRRGMRGAAALHDFLGSRCPRHPLRARGRTVLVVHHDLATVPEYFDWVTLLNVRKVASGPTAAAFTDANLKLAYGERYAGAA